MVTLQKGLRYAEEVAVERDDHYRLFRAEDATAWITFSLVFLVLIIFDNVILHRNNKALSMLAASLYTLFWVVCAFGFCGYIYWRNGHDSAFNWMSGYLLEWMLSFDNLFVFHLIFQVYATPDELKHKPLYWGICGAVFFRLLFLFIGEYLMHAMFFAHVLFGGFLIYTGVKSVTADDEDEDPSKNPMVQWLSRRMPFIGAYDAKGSFFVRVPLDENNEPIMPEGSMLPNDGQEEVEEVAEAEEQPEIVRRTSLLSYGAVDFAAVAHARPAARTQMRATMLFLVVICLEVSDILFAVDSVSAIVAQVPDLFLAYTSAVFAMLGLRAMFFIVDELVKLFQFLKYGVAGVLVFIGVKLMIGKLVHIPPGIVCLVLFGTLASSMLSSVVYERYRGPAKGDKLEDGLETSKNA